MNPIEAFLSTRPLLILDGAFATELERRGCNLNDPLWSAKVLLEDPDEIRAVHEDYFAAGADCVITASYQATLEGYRKRGLSEAEASQLIQSSVTLAKSAAKVAQTTGTGTPGPLVAASVGPYGAYLADGSEYRGDYGLSEQELIDFHRKRFELLIAAGPDLLACETIPCLAEAKALARLFTAYPGRYGWISFSARDGKHTNNGETLEECARFLDSFEQIAAVGVNCTAPKYIESLIEEIRKGTRKPIVVYPNGGERYNPDTKCWEGGLRKTSFSEMATRWYERGARIIGGCCRTTPEEIRRIAHWARNLNL